MTRKFALSVLGCATLSMLAGCAGFWQPLETLTTHDSAFVSVPATTGAWIAGIAGVPLAIVALPVTAGIASSTDASLLPLAPVFAVAQVGAIALGGLPWLVID